MIARPSLAMPSSCAITAAVRGMIPRDHHRPNSGAFRRVRPPPSLPRGGSIMPMSPRKTRSCSIRSSDALSPRTPRSAANVRRHAKRPQRLRRRARHSSGESPLAASSFRGRRSLSHQFVRAPRQQHVRSAFREHRYCSPFSRRLSMYACSSACAPTKTALPRLAANVPRGLGAEACLAGGDEERAFRGVSLHGPPSVALLHGGVICAIGDGERSLQFDCAALRRCGRLLHGALLLLARIP